MVLSRTVVALVVVVPILSTPAFAQMGPQMVVVAPVERRSIELTQPLVASVEPVTSARIAAEEQMLVAERMFDEGQRVEKGAVLVRGNTDLLEAQKAAADARLASAQAELRVAQAERDFADRELVRVEKLFQSNNVSEKELNDARTEAEKDRATVDVRSAEIAEAQAEVQRLEQLLAKAQVRAPLSGVIASRHVEVGQWLGQGDPVADIVQLDPLHVRVNVPESVLSRVKVGDQATVVVDALGGEPLTATIDQVLPVADRASRTFPVKLLLPNPDHKVWPGFFARVALTSQSAADVVVPLDAVVTSGTQHHVVVARDGQAAIVPVSRGAVSGGSVAVTGDLKDGDLVVTRGNEALRGGEQLMIMNPPGGAPGAAPEGAPEAPESAAG